MRRRWPTGRKPVRNSGRRRGPRLGPTDDAAALIFIRCSEGIFFSRVERATDTALDSILSPLFRTPSLAACGTRQSPAVRERGECGDSEQAEDERRTGEPEKRFPPQQDDSRGERHAYGRELPCGRGQPASASATLGIDNSTRRDCSPGRVVRMCAGLASAPVIRGRGRSR